MKRKILLSTLFTVMCSLTPVFSMDDTEEKQITVKVSYNNQSISERTRESHNTPSFSVYFEDGEKQEKLGSFAFSVGDEIALPSARQNYVVEEHGEKTYHLHQFYTFKTTDEKEVTRSFPLNYKKPWTVTLIPDENTKLKYLYHKDGRSKYMIQHDKITVFDPLNIGSPPCVTIKVCVTEDAELEGSTSAWHTIQK